MEIHIPPLKERPEDIPLLVDHFIQRHNPELKKSFQGIEEDAVRVLISLPWKGNVRELDNVIEHTMILAESERIMLKDLPAAIVASSKTIRRLPSTSKTRCDNLRSSIFCALSSTAAGPQRGRQAFRHQPVLALSQDRRTRDLLVQVRS